MSNPYIAQRRAASYEDLRVTLELINAKRDEYLASYLEPHHPAIAELARSWALEHRLTADRLSGAVAIGAHEDAEATRAAIAFGGPLPVKVSA
jgi:hypothetical protein